MADRVYSKDEAEAILARAIELQGHGEATSHAELVATARELGVAPEAIERAAAEVLDRRRDDAAVRALRARQWRGFYAHLVPYVCVGLFLGFLNIVTGGFPWAVIPMLGWGIGLASHLLVVALPDEEKLRRRVERERERVRRRAGKRARVDVRVDPAESDARRIETGEHASQGEEEAGEDEAQESPGAAARRG